MVKTGSKGKAHSRNRKAKLSFKGYPPENQLETFKENKWAGKYVYKFQCKNCIKIKEKKKKDKTIEELAKNSLYKRIIRKESSIPLCEFLFKCDLCDKDFIVFCKRHARHSQWRTNTYRNEGVF